MRPAAGGRRSPTVAALGLVMALVLGGTGVLAAADTSPEGQTIREVRIIGNSSVSTETIRSKILSRADRPLNRTTVELDTRKLVETRMFANVNTTVATPADGKGVILTFEVVEMPMLTNVEFRGLKAIKKKDVEETTGLKKGARANSNTAYLAVRQIKQLYEDKGYEHAEVRLIKGGNEADREVIFSIFEGPKSQTGEIDFVGNSFVSDDVLKTKVRSRKPLLGFLPTGHYEREGFEEDARKLTEYYQSNGYLGATVRAVVRSGNDLGSRDVTFVIDEGKRFRVRNLVFEGNRVLAVAKLKDGLKLHSGEFFNDAVQAADRKKIEGEYFSRGHIKARVMVEPKNTPDPDVVDLKYSIDEGDEYVMGQLIIKGNERTQEKVLRREANRSGLMPGERLDPSRIDKFKTRLVNLGYFQMNQQQGGKPIDVRVVNERPASMPFGRGPDIPIDDGSLARMQNPDDAPAPARPPLDEPPPMDNTPPTTTTPGGGMSPLAPYGSSPGRRFSPEPDTLPQAIPVPVPDGPPPLEPLPGRRGVGPKLQGQPSGPAGSLYGQGPTGSTPGFLNNNIDPNVNDRQEPFTANKAYADVMASVDEAPTARFSLGFGASSFGGLYGNVSVTENNFNLFAIPRSLDDITQGRAFRGAGQQLSIELSPGTLINRYSITFIDPYIFDLPVGLGVTAYQTKRFYYDWTEQRGGGRIWLSKQFGTQTVGEVGIRAEDVAITGFRYPAPALLLDSAGHTTFFSFRPSLRRDTRDNPFLPSSGEYLEGAFEEGFGTYTFGKVTAEARKYFTVGSRPDGTGKRVVTLRSFFGVTGRDTPIYERFFAGNLNSIRGFQYRGVGPFVLTANTGGIFESLTSAEYRFPWTANDHVQQVFFVDTGTVENDYKITNYRVAVGTGFRIIIPQIFKQVPLAFDLAFPVEKGPRDRLQPFNFSIGGSF